MARTNIELDDKLVREGLKMGRFNTKRELIHKALESYVRKEKLKQYFQSMAGVLKSEGKFSHRLLKEREKDRNRESRR